MGKILFQIHLKSLCMDVCYGYHDCSVFDGLMNIQVDEECSSNISLIASSTAFSMWKNLEVLPAAFGDLIYIRILRSWF